MLHVNFDMDKDIVKTTNYNETHFSDILFSMLQQLNLKISQSGPGIGSLYRGNTPLEKFVKKYISCSFQNFRTSVMEKHIKHEFSNFKAEGMKSK